MSNDRSGKAAHDVQDARAQARLLLGLPKHSAKKSKHSVGHSDKSQPKPRFQQISQDNQSAMELLLAYVRNSIEASRTARIPLADAEAACKICKLIGDFVRDEVLPQYEGNPWAMAMFARIQSGSDGWVLVDGEEGEEEEG
jgi:hypothetical protein